MTWPIFLARVMYEEPPVEPIAVGDMIDWGVRLVDGELEGWPAEMLMHATVYQPADPGTVVVAPIGGGDGHPLCVEARHPVTSRDIRAGLVADWFLPPDDSSITGIVRQVFVVARMFETRGTGTDRDLHPVGDWQLTNVRESPTRLGSTMGWRREIMLRFREHDDTNQRRPNLEGPADVVSSDLRFVGPEPGDPPVAEITGLLVRVETL